MYSNILKPNCQGNTKHQGYISASLKNCRQAMQENNNLRTEPQGILKLFVMPSPWSGHSELSSQAAQPPSSNARARVTCAQSLREIRVECLSSSWSDHELIPGGKTVVKQCKSASDLHTEPQGILKLFVMPSSWSGHIEFSSQAAQPSSSNARARVTCAQSLRVY